MSDFLRSLVARSIDLADVVQPRLPALFEPIDARSGPLSGHTFALEAVDDIPRPDETTFDVMSTVPPPVGNPEESQPAVKGLKLFTDTPRERPGNRPAMPRWGLRRPTGSDPTLIALEPIDPTPEQPPRESGPGPAPPRTLAKRDLQPSIERVAISEKRQPLAARGETDGMVPFRSDTAQQQWAALEPVIKEIVIERPIFPEPPLPAVGESTEAKTTQLRNTAEPESDTIPEPTTQGTEPSPIDALPPKVVTQPQVRPYVEQDTRAHGEPIARQEPMRTVQVTIGRVEVRAVPPPASTPKSRRPMPPVMSLDEYLRERARGGSR